MIDYSKSLSYMKRIAKSIKLEDTHIGAILSLIPISNKSKISNMVDTSYEKMPKTKARTIDKVERMFIESLKSS